MTTTTGRHAVDESNAAQAEAWDGEEGEYWAQHADRFDRAVAAYHQALMRAAAIRPRERVLDVGCGCGEASIDAARAARGGHVTGVDLSAAMLEVARSRASLAGVPDVSFLQADAQVHPFPERWFDVLLSRTGAMFFGDPAAAFTNLHRALRPGGRMLLATWRGVADNEWIQSIRTALAAGRELPAPPPDAPGPFALGDPGRVRSLLATAGFVDVRLEPVTEAMWFGADADDAQRFLLGLTGWMLEGLDAEGRRRATAALHRVLQEHLTPDGVRLGSGMWLVRARTAA